MKDVSINNSHLNESLNVHLSIIIDEDNTASIEMNIDDNINDVCINICKHYKLNENIKNKLKNRIEKHITRIKHEKKNKKNSQVHSNQIIKRLHYEAVQSKQKKAELIEKYKKEELEKELKALTFTPIMNTNSNLYGVHKKFKNFEDNLYYEYIKEKNNIQIKRLLKGINEHDKCRQFINKNPRRVKIDRSKSKSKMISKSQQAHQKLKQTNNSNENNAGLNIIVDSPTMYFKGNEINKESESNISHNKINNHLAINPLLINNSSKNLIKDLTSSVTNITQTVTTPHGIYAFNNHINAQALGINFKKPTQNSYTIMNTNTNQDEQVVNNDNAKKLSFKSYLGGNPINNNYKYPSQNPNVSTYAELYKNKNINISTISNNSKNNKNFKVAGSQDTKYSSKDIKDQVAEEIVAKTNNEAIFRREGRAHTLTDKNKDKLLVTDSPKLSPKLGRKYNRAASLNPETANKIQNNLNLIVNGTGEKISPIHNNNYLSNFSNFKENSPPLPMMSSKYGTHGLQKDHHLGVGGNNFLNSGSLIEMIQEEEKENISEKKSSNKSPSKDVISSKFVDKVRYRNKNEKGLTKSSNTNRKTSYNKFNIKLKSFSDSYGGSGVISVEGEDIFTRLYSSNREIKKSKDDHIQKIIKKECPFTPKINERSRKIISDKNNNQPVFERLSKSTKNLKIGHNRSKSFTSLSLDHKHSASNLKKSIITNSKNNKSSKHSSGTLKLNSYEVNTGGANTQYNSNIISLSPKSVSFLSSRPRSRIKIREIKQENDLYNSIEKVNNKNEKLKAHIHKRIDENIKNFKLNNFKEYFEIIYNNCEQAEDFQKMEKFGIPRNIKEKLILPACFIIKERNLEFNFQNFYMIANEIMNYII